MWATTRQNQQSECAPSEDSDQPGHRPCLIRVFAVRMKKAWVLSYSLSAQRRLWSDWADAQADLSLRWAHTHFVGFVMSWLMCLEDAEGMTTNLGPDQTTPCAVSSGSILLARILGFILNRADPISIWAYKNTEFIQLKCQLKDRHISFWEAFRN